MAPASGVGACSTARPSRARRAFLTPKALLLPYPATSLQDSGLRLRSMRTRGAFPCANHETLAELLLSFFSAWSGLLHAWLEDSGAR